LLTVLLGLEPVQPVAVLLGESVNEQWLQYYPQQNDALNTGKLEHVICASFSVYTLRSSYVLKVNHYCSQLSD